MSDNRLRRFWQLHLSTAILLMFVAGGFTWLLLPDWRTVFDSNLQAPLEQFANPAKEPNPHDVGLGEPWDTGKIDFNLSMRERWKLFKAKHFWFVIIAENLAALVALVGIAVLIEYVTRRRERGSSTNNEN